MRDGGTIISGFVIDDNEMVAALCLPYFNPYFYKVISLASMRIEEKDWNSSKKMESLQTVMCWRLRHYLKRKNFFDVIITEEQYHRNCFFYTEKISFEETMRIIKIQEVILKNYKGQISLSCMSALTEWVLDIDID